MIFCASTRNKLSTFWAIDDPFAEKYKKISECLNFGTNIFQDDDGRVYFYWGCDSWRQIYGQELNPDTLMPIGEKKELIFSTKDAHGWERRTYQGAPKEKLNL